MKNKKLALVPWCAWVFLIFGSPWIHWLIKWNIESALGPGVNDDGLWLIQIVLSGVAAFVSGVILWG